MRDVHPIDLRQPTRELTNQHQRSAMSFRPVTLPDPNKFKGSRKDLHRFTHQIHDKMITNCDRFLTPQTRMTYVTSRLGALPYVHIIP
jgi:hypothetical protein